MTYDLYMLPGTGHPNGGDGVCETFMAQLDVTCITAHIVSYPAQIGGTGMPYADSRAAGRKALIDAIRSTSNLALIGGYSQGAAIAGDLAAEIITGDLPDLQVVGCTLLADSRRPIGGGMPGRPITGGYGIEEQRPIGAKIPTYWAAHPGDPISSLPAGDPLRSLADMVQWYSIASAPAAYAWAQDLYDRTKHDMWQAWWQPQNWRDWLGALGFAANYLAWGYHGSKYVTDGYCNQLAAVVNQAIASRAGEGGSA
jgi:hypothetical protein